MSDFKSVDWCFCCWYWCWSSVHIRSFRYNTWPLMNGQVIPDGLLAKDEPVWKNFFENVPMVQFNHRNMAYVTMSISYHLLYKILKARIGGPFTVAGLLAVVMINYQAFSGILTLLNLVPKERANMHQMTAIITLTSVLLMVYLAKVPLLPIWWYLNQSYVNHIFISANIKEASKNCRIRSNLFFLFLLGDDGKRQLLI